LSLGLHFRFLALPLSLAILLLLSACNSNEVADTGGNLGTDDDLEDPCGNGVLDSGEECDDGNDVDGDGCSGLCIDECVDGDGDGHLTPECGGADCNDDYAQISPDVEEICGNGVDDDCDALNTPDLFDLDDDRYDCSVDCDDNDPAVRPDRPEVGCNGVDDDCSPATVDAPDLDGDGYAGCLDDCDDFNLSVNPGAVEICGNSVDDDCDILTWDTFDNDGDGFYCTLDCDDNNAQVRPNGIEVGCNGLDDDCQPATLDRPDRDSDGVASCAGDCNDDPLAGGAQAFPGNTEDCDGLDNNCDGLIDEGLSTDADGDGHFPLGGCATPADDCDDTNPARFPGATEVCNGADDDCDGVADDGLFTDLDGDGHYTPGSCGSPADDCDDGNPLR